MNTDASDTVKREVILMLNYSNLECVIRRTVVLFCVCWNAVARQLGVVARVIFELFARVFLKRVLFCGCWGVAMKLIDCFSWLLGC